MLDDDRNWAKKYGIVVHPSITINNITYRGEMEGIDIFKAICTGFKDRPEVCRGDKVLMLTEKSNTELMYVRRSLVKMYHIIAAVVLVVIVNGVALMFYRKYQKKKVNEEIHLQVNSAVSQYFKLSGKESNQI